MDMKDMQMGRIEIGKVVALDGGATKDAAAESIRKLRDALPTYLEHVALVASFHRGKYLALMKEGFTEAQALELCKTL